MNSAYAPVSAALSTSLTRPPSDAATSSRLDVAEDGSLTLEVGLERLPAFQGGAELLEVFWTHAAEPVEAIGAATGRPRRVTRWR